MVTKFLEHTIGFHRLRTTAYHPQTNGMVERWHRTLKQSLMAKGKNWPSDLPIVLLGLRSIPNENGISPFTAVTGTTILMPNILNDKTSPTINSDYIEKFSKSMSQLDFANLSEGIIHGTDKKQYIPKDLFNATHVWLRIDRVRKPLEAPYTGPFKIIKLLRNVVIIDNNGKEESVTIERTKPAHLEILNLIEKKKKKVSWADQAPAINKEPAKSNDSTNTNY